MFEKFKPANDNVENSESNEAWRGLKEKAPEVLAELLEKNDLPASIEGLSVEDAESVSEKVQELIDELSFDEAGEVKNENRYVVRDLGVYGNLVDTYIKYQQSPRPSFMAEAANDNEAPLAEAA